MNKELNDRLEDLAKSINAFSTQISGLKASLETSQYILTEMVNKYILLRSVAETTMATPETVTPEDVSPSD